MKVAALYILSVLGAVALFFLIRNYGENLNAPRPPLERTSDAVIVGAAPSILPHLLLAVAAVVAIGRLFGWFFQRFGQPPVIGEVIGGILLGPSLLGMLSPTVYQFLLPPSVAPFLGVVAQLGVLLYMFLIGLELNPEMLRKRARVTIAISHASIVVPFILGAGLALYIYPRFSTSDVPFTGFALFIGLAMSITAFPVLARILSDQNISRTELGAIALTCASVDDVTAWCLLAFVVGVVHGGAGGAMLVALLTIGFAALMFFLVRPLLLIVVRHIDSEDPKPAVIAPILVGLLLSAWTTETIGIHAIFGAFLFGVVIPHDSRLARALQRNLESLTILLLPPFFAFTGMRTEIGLLSSPYEWFVCGLIILVAIAGKFGGTFFAARATGLGWRDASGLGILMNTRGLMELIVLNVGLELGVISSVLFAMMVLMALATTLMTTPILRRVISLPLTPQVAVPTMTRH